MSLRFGKKKQSLGRRQVSLPRHWWRRVYILRGLDCTLHDNILGADTVHAQASFNVMDTNQVTTIISKDEFVKYHLEYYLSTENTLNSTVLMDRGNCIMIDA